MAMPVHQEGTVTVIFELDAEMEIDFEIIGTNAKSEVVIKRAIWGDDSVVAERDYVRLNLSQKVLDKLEDEAVSWEEQRVERALERG